jgi:hypothetical protein
MYNQSYTVFTSTIATKKTARSCKESVELPFFAEFIDHHAKESAEYAFRIYDPIDFDAISINGTLATQEEGK